MYRFFAGWVAVLVVLLLLTVRLGTDTPADITLNNDTDPKHLDPATASWHHELRAITGLFEGLLRVHPKTMTLVPGVAEKWSVSPDGLRYTFHLRRDARWAHHSRGDLGPVTAEDFLWSWRRVLTEDTASEYYALFFLIKNAERFYKKECPWSEVGVKAPDPHTVTVELTAPAPYFLELTAFCTFNPVHPATVEADPKHWELNEETFVGNGPFVLAEWSFHRRLRLVKNPHYWDAANVRTNSLDLLPIDNDTTAMLNFQAGYLDGIFKVPDGAANVMYRRMRDGESRPEMHFVPAFGTYFYRLNCLPQIKHPDNGRQVPNPLTDPKVRTALSLAIDRVQLTELIGLGKPPMAGFVPTDTLATYPGIAYDHKRDFDPARARKLLDDAGFSDRRRLPPLEIAYNKSELHEQIALFVRDAWQRELGVVVRVKSMEFKLYSTAQENLDFMIGRSAWFGDYPDPTTFLDMFRSDNGHNQTGWKHPPYDDLMNRAAVEPDVKKRSALLEQAERILVFDQRPIIPLYRYVNSEMVRPDIKGYWPNPRGLVDLKYLYRE